jgi:hypothetical protein
MASPLCRGSSVLLTPFLAINGVCERACFDHAPLQPILARGAPFRGTRTMTDRAAPRRCAIHPSAWRADWRLLFFCLTTELLPADRASAFRQMRLSYDRGEVARAYALTNRCPRDNLFELPRRVLCLPPQ